MRSVLLALILLSSTESAAQQLHLADRKVANVLREYEAAGYKFLYSSGLVTQRLRFGNRPVDELDTSSPIERLKSALESLDLTLRQSNDTWLLVRASNKRTLRQLTGRVTNESTNEPVAGVRVVLGSYSAVTNDQGEFTLLDNAASSEVVLSHADFESHAVASNSKVEALLDIAMKPVATMEQIVVVSSRHAIRSAADTSSHEIGMELIESMPKLGEDPLRIAHHLPGMATIGVSAKPHIRGGSQDELLVLFNNIELLEPFHLRDFQSVFSTFNPSLIRSIDVYTGGFPAKFGDRMSGVMAIDPTEQHLSPTGEISISLLNSSLLLHDSLAEGRADWVISARRGNLDVVTKQINSTLGDPKYNDWFGQFSFEIDGNTELDLGVIGYADNIKLSDFDVDGEIAESEYDNVYAWAQVHRRWSENVDGSSYLYYGSVEHNRKGLLLDEFTENGEAFVRDDRSFQLWSVGQNLHIDVSDRILVELGARIIHQTGDYDYDARIARGNLANFLGLQLIDDRAIRLRPKGLSGGAYGSFRYQLSDKIALEAGMRWDFQDYTGHGSQDQFSPRLSMRFDVNESNQLRFSVGRFYQPEGIHELQVGDGISVFQDEQFADHFIAGWHKRFSETHWSLRTEIFHKSFRTPKSRFENLFNSQVLLPELSSDRVQIAPTRARANGVEITLNYQPDHAKLIWLTYTHSTVEDKIDGSWVPRIWDQGDGVSVGVSWEFNQWTIGASALWHAGWRTTRLPGQINDGETVQVRRNAHRLRDYFSLDLQVSRTWRWDDRSLTVFAEITNVANRHNIGGVEYEIERNVEDGNFRLDPEEQTLLPLVPSLGLRWRF